MDVINNIKILAKNKGLTLSNIATNIGITPNTLYRSLKGDPKISTLKKIADQIECSMEDIFTPAAHQQHNNKTDNTLICPVCGAALTIIASEDPNKKEL